MNIQSPFNPDLVENNANVLPDSAFSNKEREDGRGLPKVGKKYEATLALLQIHKDGLETEYKHLFTKEHMGTVEQLSETMKKVAKLFSIDPDNFTVSDAYILMPTYRSRGHDAQVAFFFGDGSYKEYYRPVIKKNEDNTYNVAIQDATEGVYLTVESKGDLWQACMEQLFVYIKHFSSSFDLDSYGSDAYFKYLSGMTKYFDEFPTDEKKSHALAAFNPDLASEAMGINSLSEIQKRDVFRLLPQSINYVPTYEDFRLKLTAFLQHDPAKAEYALSYILNDARENKNLLRDKKVRKNIGDTILEIKGSSLEGIVRKAYSIFRLYAHQFPGNSHNEREKHETALRNHLEYKFSRQVESSHHVNKILTQYLSEDTNQEDKQQLREELQKKIDMDSSNAYDPQYYLCLSVLFDLDETIQKQLAIKTIQSGLIGKVCRNERGMSLDDVWNKKGIILPHRKDHVLNSLFSNEDVETITKGFAISAEELSIALRDVYLLRELRDGNFVQSRHIKNHNTYGEGVPERIWALMTTADQDYIINLEIALGRPLTPANAGTEDQQKKKKVLNDSRFDQRISYDNLVILCQKFHLSPEEIATAHRNEREKNSSISCDAGTHLQKMLIERIADTGSEYEKKFSAFVRDVATLNEDLEKKHINHQRFNHTYPKQPLFFFEDGDKFIVTDKPEKYPGLEFLATIKMTNYSNYWSHGYVSGNTDYYEKDKSIILSTNSYFAWKQTWKNEYIGAFMKAMPEAYKNDATHGVLTISRLV